MDASLGKDRPAAATNGLHRLILLDWTPGILAIVGGLLISFFLFGFWNPYWRVADQDILMIYDAFLQNDGLQREVAYHPAHLIVLALSGIFRLLHSIGLLGSDSLSTLPPASNVAAYNQAWTDVVEVARLVSLAIALSYVTAFGLLLRRLVGDWRVATLGVFAIAFSGGLAMSARSVKPELISASLSALALLVALIAARSPRMAARPLLVGAAALLATLAMDNKVQAICLILTLPVLLLPFGETSTPGGYWSQRRAGWWVLAALTVAALLAAAAAAPLVREGLIAGAAGHPLFGAVGVFHALLTLWIGIGMLAFALLWRVPPVDALAAAVALVGGVAIGLLPLYISHETAVVVPVINPIERLWMFVACPPSGCPGLLTLLFDGVWTMLKHHSFFFSTSSRPAIFLEWAVIAGTIFAFRRGEYKVTLQVVFLIGAVLAIDTSEAARAIKQDYFQFTDPLIVIAATMLLAQVPALQYSRWTYPIGAALIALHVAFSQAEPIKHAFLLRSGPETKCSILNNLRQLERFPFCR